MLTDQDSFLFAFLTIFLILSSLKVSIHHPTPRLFLPMGVAP